MLAAPNILPSPTPPQIYRQFFTAEERRLLDSTTVESALSEISLLRILLMHLIGAARASGPRKTPLSLQSMASMLAAFSHAGHILASLVRFEDQYLGLGSGHDPLLAILAELDPDDL
jgi:hypothetical protein